jgi:hypothetical protein
MRDRIVIIHDAGGFVIMQLTALRVAGCDDLKTFTTSMSARSA